METVDLWLKKNGESVGKENSKPLYGANAATVSGDFLCIRYVRMENRGECPVDKLKQLPQIFRERRKAHFPNLAPFVGPRTRGRLFLNLIKKEESCLSAGRLREFAEQRKLSAEGSGETRGNTWESRGRGVGFQRRRERCESRRGRITFLNVVAVTNAGEERHVATTDGNLPVSGTSCRWHAVFPPTCQLESVGFRSIERWHRSLSGVTPNRENGAGPPSGNPEKDVEGDWYTFDSDAWDCASFRAFAGGGTWHPRSFPALDGEEMPRVGSRRHH